MTLIKEIDYGTPVRGAPSAQRHARHRRRSRSPCRRAPRSCAAADGAGHRRCPKLCATDRLEAFGSCRLCLVEIEGRQGHARLLHHAGRARHEGARRRRRSSPKLRSGVMELYISDHPLDCLTCAANGDCELQDMAGAVGLREVRYGYEGDEPPRRAPKDAVQPLLHLRSRPSASSARAACAPARRCRAPSR